MYLDDGPQTLYVRLLRFQQEPHDMMSHLLLQEEGREGGIYVIPACKQWLSSCAGKYAGKQESVHVLHTAQPLPTTHGPQGDMLQQALHRTGIGSLHSPINIITMTANTCSHAH